MNLRPQHRRPTEINIAVTPLIDVILVLLIFFMVTTTFKTEESRLRVQLPRAQGDGASARDDTMIRILIDPAGHFYVNGQGLVDEKPETLVLALRGALGGGKAVPVLIQADARATHQAVMTAMDAASQAGLHRIAFAAVRPEAPAP